MGHSGLEPDLITFSTILKGYCKRSDLDKALQVAEAIKHYGLHCDELVYNTLIDTCVRLRDIATGVGLFEEMIQNGLKPSASTYGILQNLYRRAGVKDGIDDKVAQLHKCLAADHHLLQDASEGHRSQTQPLGFNDPTQLPREAAQHHCCTTSSISGSPCTDQPHPDCSWGCSNFASAVGQRKNLPQHSELPPTGLHPGQMFMDIRQPCRLLVCGPRSSEQVSYTLVGLPFSRCVDDFGSQSLVEPGVSMSLQPAQWPRPHRTRHTCQAPS